MVGVLLNHSSIITIRITSSNPGQLLEEGQHQALVVYLAGQARSEMWIHRRADRLGQLPARPPYMSRVLPSISWSSGRDPFGTLQPRPAHLGACAPWQQGTKCVKWPPCVKFGNQAGLSLNPSFATCKLCYLGQAHHFLSLSFFMYKVGMIGILLSWGCSVL